LSEGSLTLLSLAIVAGRMRLPVPVEVVDVEVVDEVEDFDDVLLAVDDEDVDDLLAVFDEPRVRRTAMMTPRR